MSADDRPFHLILDTSAIVAFTKESVHVGELISLVAEEGGLVGLPVPCLVEARCTVGDNRLFDLLVDHPATTVAQTPGDWRALAQVHHLVGRFDASSAMLTAIDEMSYVLTGAGHLYGDLLDGGRVIEF